MRHHPLEHSSQVQHLIRWMMVHVALMHRGQGSRTDRNLLPLCQHFHHQVIMMKRDVAVVETYVILVNGPTESGTVGEGRVTDSGFVVVGVPVPEHVYLNAAVVELVVGADVHVRFGETKVCAEPMTDLRIPMTPLAAELVLVPEQQIDVIACSSCFVHPAHRLHHLRFRQPLVRHQRNLLMMDAVKSPHAAAETMLVVATEVHMSRRHSHLAVLGQYREGRRYHRHQRRRGDRILVADLVLVDLEHRY